MNYTYIGAKIKRKLMNTFKNRLLGLALVGLMLGGCSQMATFEEADLMNEQAVANKAGFTMNPFGIGGNENAAVSTSGNFTLTYEAVVCSGTESKAKFGGTGWGTSTRNVQIQKETSPGVWEQVFHKPQASNEVEGDLGVLPVGVHKFRWSVSGQGGPNNVYFTITVNNCGCDSSFSALTTCNGPSRTATFTFKAGEDASYKIQGGLTAFISDVAVDGASVLKIVGQGNNIISWTGNLKECDEHTITVTWNSTNGDPDIIGDWSVERNGVKILVLDPLECGENGVGYSPII
jgi:hypothetical protein